jgi:hypothetical protein
LTSPACVVESKIYATNLTNKHSLIHTAFADGGTLQSVEIDENGNHDVYDMKLEKEPDRAHTPGLRTSDRK